MQTLLPEGNSLGGFHMNSRLISPEADELFDALLLLKSREECYDFFEDIATIQEIKALSMRLQIAKRLYYNNETYEAISQDFGVSASTIGRVNSSLMYGTGGYKTILDRIRE